MGKSLVIVESPAKAKTIKKYLGRDFEVLASYGHVRDLIPKEGAVDPYNNFNMKYQVIEKNERHVQAIAKALQKSDALYLATDPDRPRRGRARGDDRVAGPVFPHADEGLDHRRPLDLMIVAADDVLRPDGADHAPRVDDGRLEAVVPEALHDFVEAVVTNTPSGGTGPRRPG